MKNKFSYYTNKFSHTLPWRIFINGIIVPILILLFSIIFSYLSIILVNIFFESHIELGDGLLKMLGAWIPLYAIGYTVYFWYIEKQEKDRNRDLHNFALLEPLPFYDAAFINGCFDIKLNDDKKTYSITSMGRIYELFKKEIALGYHKYIHCPFSNDVLEEGTPLMSIVNRGKDYGEAKYLHILFRKKLDPRLNKEVYIEDNDINYTVVEKGPTGYYFPYKESHTIPFVYMDPSENYTPFYNYIRKTKQNFVVIISYKSIINNRDIIQAYQCYVTEDKTFGPYIQRFAPMSHEDIRKEIEPEFAARIIKDSVYGKQL